MSYDAATAYIERYNAMVDRVNAVADRYASGAASSLADAVGDLTETDTPLGDAHPFEYTPNAVSGDVEQLAGGDGRPANNQAQNKQFRAVVKALGLSQDQARQLHDEIQDDEELNYHGLLGRAQEMFRGSD
jgi:hypothetical protein